MTDTLALLLTDDEALGRTAAAAILATDVAACAALHLVRTGEAAGTRP